MSKAPPSHTLSTHHRQETIQAFRKNCWSFFSKFPRIFVKSPNYPIPRTSFQLLEELEISHLFFGFTSFCMESQKQLYHNPPTHLPSTNPHNWACKNSPCPKSNANPSHPPPPPTRNDSSIMRDYWKSCSLTRQREADLQTHHFAKHVCETSLRTSQQKHAER